MIDFYHNDSKDEVFEIKIRFIDIKNELQINTQFFKIKNTFAYKAKNEVDYVINDTYLMINITEIIALALICLKYKILILL